MQVDSFSSSYTKAQQETETHVDVWTELSTPVGKHADAGPTVVADPEPDVTEPVPPEVQGEPFEDDE